MALSGSITTGAYDGRSLTLNWSATQDTANNTSTISWSVVGSGGTSPSWVYIHELRVTINNEVVKYVTDVNKKCYVGTEIVSTTKTSIKHNNDGTKSFIIKLEAGIYWNKINKSASKTFTLNAIPRAASVSSAQNITLGNKCSIKWQPKLNAHKYKLKFSLGKWNNTTAFISPNTTSAYTYSGYTIPLEVANQLPSSTTGKMNVSLYTYDSNGKQIGSTSNSTFTVTVPDSIKPTISNVEASIVQKTTINGTFNTTPMANISKVKMKAEGSGIYESTIVSYVITGYYNNTIIGETLDYTGDVITSSGEQTFKVAAKDSRGRLSNEVVKSFDFADWQRASLISSNIKRDENDQTKIKVTARVKTNAFPNINGTGMNSGALVDIYYKESTSKSFRKITEDNVYYDKEDNETLAFDDFIWGVSIPDKTGLIDNTKKIILKGFSADKSYVFQLRLKDWVLLSDGYTDIVNYYVSPKAVTMDFRAGGEGVGIGRISEADGLEIGFETTFFNKVYLENTDTSLVKTSLEDYIKSIVNKDYIKSLTS